MEEKPTDKKDNKGKLFIFIAISVLVALLIVSLVEIISINALNNKIKNQEETIEELNSELNYYKDNSNGNGSNIYEGSEG